jgi:ADP-ribose pyrophosphatase
VQEKMTIYKAEDLTQGEATPMDDERIEAKWFTRREIAKMIRSGKIIDGKTMIGFYIDSQARKAALRRLLAG